MSFLEYNGYIMHHINPCADGKGRFGIPQLAILIPDIINDQAVAS